MFGNLKIGVKLTAGFGIILVLLAAIGVCGYLGAGKMRTIAEDAINIDGKVIEQAERIRMNILQLRRFEKDLFLNVASSDKVTEYRGKWDKAREQLLERITAVTRLSSEPRDKETMEKIRSASLLYVNGFNKVVEQVRAGAVITPEQGNRAIGEYKSIIHDMEKIAGDYADTAKNRMAQNEQEMDSTVRMLAVAMSGIMLLAATICLALIWFYTRGIARPIVSLARNARLIAEGDLRIEIKADSRDEIGQLAESFQLMVNSLKELISTLADTSSQVADSSGVMLTSADNMSHAADNAASQTSTVAVAAEEMSATSGDIAQNCQMVAESALRANDAAKHGAVVVENTIAVMQRIAERVQASAKTVENLGAQSDLIGSIIGTIEDIADQTNLLALNAAIEAARAGEQGRGFAVVADEVRALAERTTKATREIGAMIKAIQKDTKTAVAAMEEGVAEVEQGTREAARSGEALANIREEISSVNLQVQQMATAAEEQTATTGEISSNIHQVTNVVKQTSDDARKCVSISQQLSTLSTVLKNVVNKFTFSESNTFFAWNSSYSVGFNTMDQEHKRLVEIINNLYSAMRRGEGNTVIGPILDGLVEYTGSHFTHEERLMKEAGYAAYDEHKREHDSLTRQVLEIQNKYRAGAVLSLEIMSFVKDWLVNHIQGSDKRYGPHLVKKGIR
ncbi:MAG: bacteriohemerythrin [Desulfuromonadaceae bacterium]|nr:bacteriohemerythrin [Desulfuromonadaceae bacterium]MDD5107072.1 bacteriohemerythrin [Desulfuromonadaceae bacterium]